MGTWMKQHTILTILAVVAIITVVNLAIFVPKYITEQKQITAVQLEQDAQELDHIAESASKVSQAISQSPDNSSTQQAELEALIGQTDVIIIHLQSTSRPDELEDTATQTLQLAQIMSFGMRDLKLDAGNQLKAAKTAQVMHQASITAQTLAEEASED